MNLSQVLLILPVSLRIKQIKKTTMDGTAKEKKIKTSGPGVPAEKCWKFKLTDRTIQGEKRKEKEKPFEMLPKNYLCEFKSIDSLSMNL